MWNFHCMCPNKNKKINVKKSNKIAFRLKHPSQQNENKTKTSRQ